MNTTPLNLIRRKLWSGTVLSKLSTEEMILDQELTSHLSLKNLYDTSKLVKEQNEIIKQQEVMIEYLNKEHDEFQKKMVNYKL